MTKTIWIAAEVLIRFVRQIPMRETNGHPDLFRGRHRLQLWCGRSARGI